MGVFGWCQHLKGTAVWGQRMVLKPMNCMNSFIHTKWICSTFTLICSKSNCKWFIVKKQFKFCRFYAQKYISNLSFFHSHWYYPKKFSLLKTLTKSAEIIFKLILPPRFVSPSSIPPSKWTKWLSKIQVKCYYLSLPIKNSLTTNDLAHCTKAYPSLE